MRQKAVRDFFAFWITNNEQQSEPLNVTNKRVLNTDINGGGVMQLRCLVGENEGETVCLREHYFCPSLKLFLSFSRLKTLAITIQRAIVWIR